MPAFSEMPGETFEIEDRSRSDEGVVTETSFGVWQTRTSSDGKVFREFLSHIHFFGWPLVNYTSGIHPDWGKRKTAKGIIAIGRKACGVIAIGQASIGLIAIGQLAIGILFGLGQLATGIVSVGQAAIAVYFALGQFGVAEITIAQFGYGTYVLAQYGWGEHVWDIQGVSPIAQKFFRGLWPF